MPICECLSSTCTRCRSTPATAVSDAGKEAGVGWVQEVAGLGSAVGTVCAHQPRLLPAQSSNSSLQHPISAVAKAFADCKALPQDQSCDAVAKSSAKVGWLGRVQDTIDSRGLSTLDVRSCLVPSSFHPNAADSSCRALLRLWPLRSPRQLDQ